MSKTVVKCDGYTVKTKAGGRVASKLPFFCPYEECGRITDSMDDAALRKYGVCANCYIDLVENRNKPLIDVEFYKQRLAERGY